MAEATGPGLLYVNSKITSSKLSPELFTTWYEDVHIPDIFVTSGIKSAFRYFTTASELTAIERPYLALYPLKNVEFLQSEEFKSIPVHSDILPTESKCIFDLADFDTRYYLRVGVEEASENLKEPAPFLVSSQFDIPGSQTEDVITWYSSKRKSNVVGTRLFQLYFGRQNRLPEEESQLEKSSQFLALHEFGNEQDAQKFMETTSVDDNIFGFRLLKAFRS